MKGSDTRERANNWLLPVTAETKELAEGKECLKELVKYKIKRIRLYRICSASDYIEQKKNLASSSSRHVFSSKTAMAEIHKRDI